LKESLIGRFSEKGLDLDQADGLATAAIKELGLKLDGEKTQYLLLIGEQEIDRLAESALIHRETLLSDSGKKASQETKAARDELLSALDGGGAVDLALFGRMIADRPDKNVDAAAQVAHAISTHAVATEFDFYSAVDDLQTEDSDEGAGAGMLGTTLYNSACYYRYANLDLKQLAANLHGDEDHIASAVRCFVAGMIHSVPSGKQTASAAQNPPAVVFAIARDHGLWSLANAFVSPITIRGNEDLVAKSADAMFAHFARLSKMYGADGVRYAGAATYLDDFELPEGVRLEDNVSSLIESTLHGLSVSARA